MVKGLLLKGSPLPKCHFVVNFQVSFGMELKILQYVIGIVAETICLCSKFCTILY